MKGARLEAIKTIAFGVVWCFGAIAIWLSAAGNPIDDLRLVLSARIAPGQVTDSSEDAEDRDDGGTAWYHAVAYTFRLPDGREVKSGSSGPGRLRPDFVELKQPVPTDVEYLPESPSVNRLKGSGSQTVTEWFLRKVGAGGLFLALLLWPGVRLIRDGTADFRTSRNTPSEPWLTASRRDAPLDLERLEYHKSRVDPTRLEAALTRYTESSTAFEPPRSKLNDTDVKELFDTILACESLSDDQKFEADMALMGLLDGIIPSAEGLHTLKTVFGEELADTIGLKAAELLGRDDANARS
jgi:hypothetical protein